MPASSISYPHHHHHHHHHQHQHRSATTTFLQNNVAMNEKSLSSHHHHQHQSRRETGTFCTAMATCYPLSSYELASPTTAAVVAAAEAVAATPPSSTGSSCGSNSSTGNSQRTTIVPPSATQKDYSRPLHVDCSVEYELPNAAKPPQGVRNEPLLMIHPCYFRKIESQKRSPFINNLPARPAASVPKRRTTAAATAAAVAAAVAVSSSSRGQQLPPQQVPVQAAAPYPVQYQTQERSIWDHHHHHHHHQLAPTPPYCKRDVLAATAACAAVYTATAADVDRLWMEPECSPERPDDNKLILSGKYRQYLRGGHRLHPYVSSALPIASTFPHQIQQVCYNV